MALIEAQDFYKVLSIKAKTDEYDSMRINFSNYIKRHNLPLNIYAIKKEGVIKIWLRRHDDDNNDYAKRDNA